MAVTKLSVIVSKNVCVGLVIFKNYWIKNGEKIDVSRYILIKRLNSRYINLWKLSVYCIGL